MITKSYKNCRFLKNGHIKKMKLLLLTFFVVYVRATSEPFDAKKVVDRAFEKCVQGHDKDAILAIWKQDIYSEDDDFLKFYDCFGDELNLFDKDGEVNFELLTPKLEEYIKVKFGDSVDAKKFAKESSEYCSRTPKVEPRALNGLRRRNCGVEYILKHK